MSTIKTWYTSIGNWSLLQPDGSEHPRFQIFSRPYPQRIAGVPGGFSFDFNSRQWQFRWDEDPAVKAPTVVFVPLGAHYPNGFRLAVDNMVQLETDRANPAGLRSDGKSKQRGCLGNPLRLRVANTDRRPRQKSRWPHAHDQPTTRGGNDAAVRDILGAIVFSEPAIYYTENMLPIGNMNYGFDTPGTTRGAA